MTAIERYVMPGILRIKLGLLAACLFVVGTNGFVIAGLLPEVAHDLGVAAADDRRSRSASTRSSSRWPRRSRRSLLVRTPQGRSSSRAACCSSASAPSSP